MKSKGIKIKYSAVTTISGDQFKVEVFVNGKPHGWGVFANRARALKWLLPYLKKARRLVP